MRPHADRRMHLRSSIRSSILSESQSSREHFKPLICSEKAPRDDVPRVSNPGAPMRSPGPQHHAMALVEVPRARRVHADLGEDAQLLVQVQLLLAVGGELGEDFGRVVRAVPDFPLRRDALAVLIVK